jgi:hypothetical protein
LPLVAAAGCPGVLEDPDRFRAGACLDVENEMFPRRCSTSGCHTAMEPAGMLDLQSPGVVERLIGAPAEGEECGGVVATPLLVPGNPEGSLLYQKLGDAPPCGAKMPFTGAGLTEVEIACVAQWIRRLDGDDTPDAAPAPPDAAPPLPDAAPASPDAAP